MAQWISVGTATLTLLFSLVAAAISHGMSRQKIADLSKRIGELEGEMRKVGELVTAVAVLRTELTEKFAGFKELVERDGREVRHDVSGMKMQLEKIADYMRPTAQRG